MAHEFLVSKKEKNYLRDLAKKQLMYSQLPIMKEREVNWYNHNDFKGEKPIVIMEMTSFQRDLMPELKCENEFARKLEHDIQLNIVNHELVDDDKVIPNFINVRQKINMKELNIERHIKRAKDSKGRDIGYATEHIINDLKEDFHKIEKSVYSYDKQYTDESYNLTKEIIGDILDVNIYNDTLMWFISLSARCVNIMGMERLMYSMYDYPEETLKLYEHITTDAIEYINWQQENNLLTLNNGNHLAGAGSFGFTNKLPSDESKKTGKITTKDLWINMNSQESVGISPEMYKEFIYPSYERVAKLFGLVYYGCCEPVHEIWEDCLINLPNLKKVSISPWCDEEYMGEALKDSNIIYSRKPSPNYIGVGKFDESEFRKHIKKTLLAAKGCNVEIIFRDIYTLTGELDKAKKAVAIVRELIDKYW